MASNDDTVKKFFAVFASKNPEKTKVADLMNIFCPNDAQSKTPAVGITDHGPNFTGAGEVKLLFEKLFHSFPDLKWLPAKLSLPGLDAEVEAPRLRSEAEFPSKAKPIPVIAVQTTLSGTHTHAWFPDPKDKHYSSPLSDIHPGNEKGGEGLLRTTTPTAAVFAFDANNKITHLWMYLDRYRFVHHLNPGAGALLGGYNQARKDRAEAMEKSKQRV
jgi:hypothetical protein